MKAIGSLSFVLLLVGVTSADLVITEFMANPAALGDDVGEYFEVYNAGPSSIAIDGLFLKDDGTDSLQITGTGLTIPVGGFLVLGSSSQSYVDVDYSAFGSYSVANGGDEIVITDSSMTIELSRLNYTNGDPFGAGTAAVLNNTGNSVGGTTSESDYIAEILANDTLPTTDIGSPGVAGGTVAVAVPEPSAFLLTGLLGMIASGWSLRGRIVSMFVM